MPGTQWLAAAGALATAVLATAVLTAAVPGAAPLTRAAGAATARPASQPGQPAHQPQQPAHQPRRPAHQPRQPAHQPGRLAIKVLDAVSCPSAGLCMAIGTTGPNGTPPTGASDATVVLRWNGRTWARPPVPKPRTDSLDGIWCRSATWCLAVGGTWLNASGSKSAPVAEQWDGRAWTVLPVPSQAHTFSSWLTSIDCTSPTACAAVGSYTTAKDGYNTPSYALAEGWNGTAWRLEHVNPAPSGAVLGSVSCYSARACTAVGTSGPDGPGLVAERWNGIAWAPQDTEPSGGAGPGGFSAVSCASATTCTAVGDSGGDDNQGLTETWNGRTWWGSQGMVAPSDGSTLSGVTCFSGTKCLAVGSYDGVRGNVTLAARSHGRTWSVQRTPNVPRPATDSMLGAISCASPSACLAVGGSDRGCCRAGYEIHDRALAEWWNGTTWRMLPAPVRPARWHPPPYRTPRGCRPPGSAGPGSKLAPGPGIRLARNLPLAGRPG